MMSPPLTFPSFAIKICGLSTPETMAAALDAGADMVGLVFHPRSPRFVELETAAALAGQARGRAAIVALMVDLPDETIRDITQAVRPDVAQCHGREDGARLALIRTMTGAKVMKAVGVAEASDLPAVIAAGAAADRVLIDAKPPKDAAYPGGHGRPFDWDVLAGLPRDLPFLLSGGLTPDNVAEAIGAVRGLGRDLAGVDVSSGVERAPGVKDAAKIRDFIAAARAAAGASS
jgi:phosphoribosylanthranilate isomerase